MRRRRRASRAEEASSVSGRVVEWLSASSQNDDADADDADERFILRQSTFSRRRATSDDSVTSSDASPDSDSDDDNGGGGGGGGSFIDDDDDDDASVVTPLDAARDACIDTLRERVASEADALLARIDASHEERIRRLLQYYAHTVRERAQIERDATLPPSVDRVLATSAILTLRSVMSSLYDALPARACLFNWRLLYATAADGFSMRTLIARAQRATPTLLLVEDMHGAQFGVYCTGVWQSEPFQFDDDFSGSAEMFVFHVANRAERVFVLDDDDDDDDSSSVFSGYSSSNTEDDIKNYVSEIRVVPRAVCCRATRANHYYQLISSSAGGVSFGCNSVDSQRGGGGSALTLSHDLLSGHSEPSDTYGNPCLSTHETFETRLLELWSLSSH